MGPNRHRLLLAVLLVAGAAAADQGPPVYTATGALPYVGGACTGPRVQIEATSGKTWCCVYSKWASCDAAGAAGYSTVQDEGSALTARSTLNFAGAGVTCADGSSKTTCTIPGGSGSPGGSDTQVQFNDGGAFGGDAGLVYVKATNALTLEGPLSLTGSGGVSVINGVTTPFSSGACSKWTIGANSWFGTDAGYSSCADLVSVTTGNYNISPGGNVNLNLAATGELQIAGSGGTAGQFLRSAGAGARPTWAVPTATATPAGSDTQIQFNDGGAFAGSVDLTFNTTTKMVTANNLDLTALGDTRAIRLVGGDGGTTQGARIQWTDPDGVTGIYLDSNNAGRINAVTDSGTFGLKHTPASEALGYEATAVLDTDVAATQGFARAHVILDTQFTHVRLSNSGEFLSDDPLVFQIGNGSRYSSQTAATALTLGPSLATFTTPVTATGFNGNATTATALAVDPSMCGAGAYVTDISASGTLSCSTPTPALSSIANPTGDKTFTFPSGNKLLWEFSGATDYAFSVHGTGAFTGTGDLVHLHLQGTPGVVAGADALHVEWEDTDATGLRLNGPAGSYAARLETTTRLQFNSGANAYFYGDGTGILTPGAITATGGFSGITVANLPTVTVAKGGSNLTTVAANQVYVGTAADTFTAKTLPSCSNATTSKLLYDNGTQTFSCGTDQTGGGGSIDLRGIPTVFGGF